MHVAVAGVVPDGLGRELDGVVVAGLGVVGEGVVAAGYRLDG